MKKLKILMLHLSHGGVEKQTITMANALIEFYNIEIVSFYKITEVPAYEIDKRISVKYLYDGGPNRETFKKYLKSKNFIKTFKEGLKAIKILFLKKQLIKKEILKDDVDIYFSTRHEYGALLGRYGNKEKLKLTEEHNYIETKKYQKKTVKRLKKLDYIVVISKYHLHMYKEWFKDYNVRIVQIPNILDNNSKKVSTLNNNAVIAVGRLNYIKDFSSLIDVMHYAVLNNPTLKLYLLGDGEEKENLTNKITQLNLQDNIIMPGFVNPEEVKKYMLKSDIFLMTSLRECFPMVILEAYNCGLPTISYDILTGPRELVKDGYNGFIVPNRDCKEMAKKINNLLNDKVLLKELGKNSKKDSSNYLTDKVIQKWKEILR